MKYTCVNESSRGFSECGRLEHAEGCSVAVVIPGEPIGGVKQTVNKLIKGLSLDGFCVKPIRLYGKTVLGVTISDIKNVNILRNFDAIIYMGSIPQPSHVFVHNYTKTLLFVHGFVKEELLNAIKRGKYREKVGAAYLLGLWGFSRAMDRIDTFICRCLTSCEVNGIEEDYILLPEFVLPDEVKIFEGLLKKYRCEVGHKSCNKVSVLTYTSYTESPRLLKPQHIEHLFKCVSRWVKREIDLVIVDPRSEHKIVKLAENLTVKYLKPMPKEIFYKHIMSSDLFIDLCIDEELRNTTIEAALLETPVAKLTHPRFSDRQDYGEDNLLQGYFFKDLASKIAEYLNNIEHYKQRYSKKLKDFILKHRTWNAVKKPLIDLLCCMK